VRAALDSGVTLIDTADVYCLDHKDIGHNERLIARAVGEWGGRRDTIVIATKGGMTRPGGRWETDGRPAHLREACEQSLKALKTDRIDLYQLHTPDPMVPFVDSIEALGRLQEEGKVRWLGLSNVSVAQIREAASMVPVVSVQNRLNPFFREALTGGVVRYCAEQGIGFLAYSPVGGGRLNRKLPDHPVLLSIAQRLGVTAHAIVLAWVVRQGASVIPIPSARTVDHLKDSLSAAGITLSDDDAQAIDNAEFSRA
jgi:aryl-alcohol dehydrogenase-like predicted oxidoreductase